MSLFLQLNSPYPISSIFGYRLPYYRNIFIEKIGHDCRVVLPIGSVELCNVVAAVSVWVNVRPLFPVIQSLVFLMLGILWAGLGRDGIRRLIRYTSHVLGRSSSLSLQCFSALLLAISTITIPRQNEAKIETSIAISPSLVTTSIFSTPVCESPVFGAKVWGRGLLPGPVGLLRFRRFFGVLFAQA